MKGRRSNTGCEAIWVLNDGYIGFKAKHQVYTMGRGLYNCNMDAASYSKPKPCIFFISKSTRLERLRSQ